APGLKVEAWAPGDYRLTEVTAPPVGPAAATDPARVLTLVGTLLAPGAEAAYRRVPSGRPAPARGEVTNNARLARVRGAAAGAGGAGERRRAARRAVPDHHSPAAGPGARPRHRRVRRDRLARRSCDAGRSGR